MRTYTTYTISAKGKKLGRLASEAAVLLMGKNSSGFTKNTMPSAKVTIIDSTAVDISSEKRKTKMFVSYSGYPGGIKRRLLQEVIDRRGIASVLRKAVYGMLPKNKLQSRLIKNLVITL